MKLLRHGSLLAIALGASACSVSFPRIPLAPPGVHVRPEVARGYRTFEPVLAEWGDWAPDYTYGVHWCPSRDVTGGPGVPFQPYVDRGRWGLSEAPVGKAPAGTLEWQSEDSDTWGRITSHHGWWVRVPERHGRSPYCWVPGLEETPARVAWREGDGFVGWAPEPPDWIVADEADYEDSLDWVFTLVGVLLEGASDGNLLTGEARERARAATAPEVSKNGSFTRHKAPPSGDSIRSARQNLAEYVVKHPDAIAANTPKGGSHGSASSGSRSTSSSSSSSKKKDGETPGAEVTPLPSAMTYYGAFQGGTVRSADAGAMDARSSGAAASSASSDRAGSFSPSERALRSVSPVEHAESHGARTWSSRSSSRSSSSGSSSSGSSSHSHGSSKSRR